jgi:hypothetical protein
LRACVDPFEIMDLASGLLWAVTYVLIVRRGLLDRTCGVPLVALAAAMSWEILYGVVHPTPELPRFVVPVWLALDAGVVYLYLRHAPARGDPSEPAPAWFYARFVAAIAGAFAVEAAVVRAFGDRDGAWSGFAVNVVMSLAFVAMLERRRDVRGQSMGIAIGKLAGSALAIPHAWALHGSMASLRAFMATTLLADVAYAARLHRRCRAEGIRPWERL